MVLKSIPAFTATVISLLISFLFITIYFSTRKNTVNFWYGVLCFYGAVQSFGQALLINADNKPFSFAYNATFVAILGGILLIPGSVHFVLSFYDLKNRKILWILYLICGIFVIFSLFTDLLFQHKPRGYKMSLGAMPGPLFIVFAIFCIASLFYCLLIMVNKYTSLKEEEKKHEAGYVLLGASFWVLGGFCNFIGITGICGEIPSLVEYGQIIFCITLSYILIKRYITMQYKLKEILSLNYKIAEETKRIERFTSMTIPMTQIAHDFINWIVPIKDQVEYLVKDKDLTPRGKQSVELIRKCAEKLENELNKIRKKEFLDEEKLLTKVIDDIKTYLSDSFNTKKVTFTYKIEPSLEDIKVKGGSLKVILNNILNNAIEASKDNSSIEMIVKKESEIIKIIIKDYGCGIDNERLKTIFIPHFSNKKEGLGMGLAIAKWLVEHSLNGEIAVNSTVGKGTEFIIKFPVR
ncbi:MAG: ATP-binding protein [candidate division WOR-3 bacterium]